MQRGGGGHNHWVLCCQALQGRQEGHTRSAPQRSQTVVSGSLSVKQSLQVHGVTAARAFFSSALHTCGQTHPGPSLTPNKTPERAGLRCAQTTAEPRPTSNCIWSLANRRRSAINCRRVSGNRWWLGVGRRRATESCH